MQNLLFPETSHEAHALQTEEKVSRDCGVILRWMRGQREHGGTRFEISKATGIQYSTVCGRVNELAKAGKLLATTRRRKTATGANAGVIVAPIQSSGGA